MVVRYHPVFLNPNVPKAEIDVSVTLKGHQVCIDDRIAKLGRKETWVINGSQVHYVACVGWIMIDLPKSCWLLTGRREP